MRAYILLAIQANARNRSINGHKDDPMAESRKQTLSERASAVLPGGMYGHQSVARCAPGTPQFFSRAQGAFLWDTEGKQYLDLMCGYGPQLFGYHHFGIDTAYIDQLAVIDTATGPSALIVDLAETLTSMVTHADWAIFCKNGTDATTMAMMTARAHRGARKILVANGTYHGSAPWCTPVPTGTVAEDRAHVITYDYNDIESLNRAAEEAGDDLAGIFAAPFRHDIIVEQELPDPAYARRTREICDAADALLIVDDIRAGFRIARDCSWSKIGVAPDLSSWGKALANGHPISALLGNDRAKDAAGKIYATGSFWFSAAPMAAALATLQLVQTTNYLEHIEALGTRLRDGLNTVANDAGIAISQTGPAQMPLIMFNSAVGSRDMDYGMKFCTGMIERGVYFHPWHNMFLSTAMSVADIDRVIEVSRDVIASI